MVTALQSLVGEGRSDPAAPIPTIPKARTKIPFAKILMRYGKTVILRMEMLARRR